MSPSPPPSVHMGNILLSWNDLSRRQLIVNILGHILQLGGRQHPSLDVHRFPLLVQDSAHNVHTWSFARNVAVAAGEKFLRRFQVYCGWYLFGLIVPVVAIWWQLASLEPGHEVPLWIVMANIDSVLLASAVLGCVNAAHRLNFSAKLQCAELRSARRRTLYETAEVGA